MMREKVKVLQFLIEHFILSPNHSRLAKELGTKNKQMFYHRISEEVAGEAACNRLWEQICFSYNISDFTLYNIPIYWDMANRLAEQLTAESFLPLCTCRLSGIADKEVKRLLRSLFEESMLDYYYVVALFFVKANHFEPNECKNSDVFIEILQQADAILRKHYPEEEIVHQVAMDYINLAKVTKVLGWCHTMNYLGHLLCYYTHPLCLDEMEKCEKMPFGDSSWWVDSDADAKHTTLWHLSPIDDGIYEVLHISATANQDIKKEDCTDQRWIFIAKYDTLRCIVAENGKVIRSSYYMYELEESDQQMTLHLSPRSELNDKKKTIPLPDRLKRVKQDTVWGQWISRQNHELIESIEDQLFLVSIGVEETDINVSDVSMSRGACTLLLTRGKSGIVPITLEVDKYPTLKYLKVWDDVDIVRGRADGEYYACWDKANVKIKLPNLTINMGDY